jgi:hypothetical protein
MGRTRSSSSTRAATSRRSDGEPLDPPAEDPLAVYPVVIEGGRVLIEVPDGPLEVIES